MKQERLTSLLDSEAAKTCRVHVVRTQKLRRRSKVIQVIRVLFETKSDCNFLVRDGRVIRG
jgi:hypothetical protein